MTQSDLNNWQGVQREVRRRIHAREWKPGELIPTEADLAAEFGCARATVNRALRSLAEAGLLDRRRKAGTRVALHPVGKATLNIPVIRHEVEGRGQTYGYALLGVTSQQTPPPTMQARMQLGATADLLHVRSVHLANGAPYVFEDRWINPAVVPGILAAPLAEVSPNEWLLIHAPYTHGDITFSAAAANAEEANVLSARPGDALFVIERTTWDNDRAVTSVRLVFAPGYRMHTGL